VTKPEAPEDPRRLVLAALKSGESISAAARKGSVSRQTVYDWAETDAQFKKALEALKAKRSNPGPDEDGLVVLTPKILKRLLTAASKRAESEGFNNTTDLMRVLTTLYGSGRVSKRFGATAKAMIVEWRGQEVIQGQRERKLLRLPETHYRSAIGRWKAEAAGGPTTANGLLTFLVWAYATGRINLGIAARERVVRSERPGPSLRPAGGPEPQAGGP
jgi:transposase-like protein